MLTACSSEKNNEGSGNGASKGESNEITIWAWDPSFNIAALNIAKETYEKINPDVKVNIVEYAQADIIQKLNTGLNAGTTSGLPNIVLIEDFRAKNFFTSYPDSFYPLDGLINPADYADYKIEPTSLDGKQIGLPFDSGVTGLYYRTDYLAEAGYTAEDMQELDWKEFIEMGKVVKEKTGKDMLTLDPNDLGLVRLMTQSAGRWYLDADGKPDLANNAALKESVELYKEMLDSDIVKINSDWSQFVSAFNSGDIATVTTGNWITPSVKAEASQSGKWAIAPLPTLPNNPDSVPASNLGGSSWYVLNVPGAETAADFMVKTFGSDVDMYQKLLNEIGVIGTLKAAATGEAYEQGVEFFGGQKIFKDFAVWTEQIPRVNYGLHTYAVEDIMVVEMQNYLNGKEIDKVLSDAQKQADTQIR